MDGDSSEGHGFLLGCELPRPDEKQNILVEIVPVQIN